jgi:hypothetical protein
VGVKRLVLVSSLCAGRWIHPLNLFGLILMWKRVGSAGSSKAGCDWTVIRPGGLSEREEGLQPGQEREGVVFSGADQQDSNSIPRGSWHGCAWRPSPTPPPWAGSSRSPAAPTSHLAG